MTSGKSLGSTQKWWLAGTAWLLVWLGVFWESLLSAVHVWWINESFTHCFFVLPAVIYALWQQRGALAQSTPGPSVLGGLAVLGGLLVYALGQAAHIELLQHLAMFGLLPAVFLMLFGWQPFLAVWAPLCFVMFSVPVGEELVPTFQEITADIAIWLLQVIGIPVYRDGLYISVPNGNFVVAEACSGIRFFIACLVVGCAYAYLSFISRWRALAFLAFSIVLPILANGLRAFGIIYIGHTTNMEHAVGADHLIYGWFFFALVVIVLVLVGAALSDGQRAWQNTITQVDDRWANYVGARLNLKLALLALAPLLAALLIALLTRFQVAEPFDLAPSGLRSVSSIEAQAKPWTPRFSGAAHYRIGGDQSGARLYQAIYPYNEQGEELASWSNRLYDIENWTLVDQRTHNIEGVGRVTLVSLTSLAGDRRILAYWFVTTNRVSASKAPIKLQQALNTLMLKPSGGAVVAVDLPFNGKPEQPLEDIKRILDRIALQLSSPVLRSKENTK